MIKLPEADPKNPGKVCDTVQSSDKRIRHVGYYSHMGRIIHDSIRENTVPMEGEEEKHILNGTVASVLTLWKSSDHLIGEMEALVMIRERMVGIIVPLKSGNYFLVVLEKATELQSVEKTRIVLVDAIKSM